MRTRSLRHAKKIRIVVLHTLIISFTATFMAKSQQTLESIQAKIGDGINKPTATGTSSKNFNFYYKNGEMFLWTDQTKS